MSDKRVTIVGAGLAGTEAAWQLAQRGIAVRLIDMKPGKKTPAHQSEHFAELVCSNSLRANRIQNAVGLLKEEMRRLDSLIVRAADETSVPAGGALAVDRESFSQRITSILREHPLVEIIEEEVKAIPASVFAGDKTMIVATGPLTSTALSDSISNIVGEGLYFFDAAAPIVTRESLDDTKVFSASRYGKGGDDYINAPMNREEYFAFLHELVSAETVQLHDFENARVFEGCMPVEVMAARGEMTLAFGPLKPMGLTDPATGKRPFAVVQLRQDNAEATLYNLVGFQTHLTFPEQRRVFRMIPGLENAEFARYGVMHRNTFIHSPGKLNAHFQSIAHPSLYFAGQITGVEGYVESAASGLMAGMAAAAQAKNQAMADFSTRTAHGALARHVSAYMGGDFQPMNISFGLIDSLDERIKNKQERYTAIAERALLEIDQIATRETIR